MKAEEYRKQYVANQGNRKKGIPGKIRTLIYKKTEDRTKFCSDNRINYHDLNNIIRGRVKYYNLVAIKICEILQIEI